MVPEEGHDKYLVGQFAHGIQQSVGLPVVSEEQDEIKLGEVTYDPATRRIKFYADESFGFAEPHYEPVEMFGQESALAVGTEIQAMAQILDGNEVAVGLYNDMVPKYGRAGALDAVLILLDHQSPERKNA